MEEGNLTTKHQETRIVVIEMGLGLRERGVQERLQKEKTGSKKKCTRRERGEAALSLSELLQDGSMLQNPEGKSPGVKKKRKGGT